jgi:plastocyanin
MLALPLAGLVVFERSDPVAAATINIPIQGTAYHGPNGNGDITIFVGTSVTWTNNDFGLAHTATSDDQPPAFNTGTITTGMTSSPITFNTPGTFNYHCQFHPTSMKGTITVLPVPAVTGVNPASGATTGGTTVTVAGTNFENGATVSFGGAMATSVTFVNSGTLTATLPPHAAGVVDVTVTNPDTGVGTGTGLFTYVIVNPVPGMKPAGPEVRSNPNPLPGLLPSPGNAGGAPNALPSGRSLRNPGDTAGSTDSGTPVPAPLPLRR